MVVNVNWHNEYGRVERAEVFIGVQTSAREGRASVAHVALSEPIHDERCTANTLQGYHMDGRERDWGITPACTGWSRTACGESAADPALNKLKLAEHPTVVQRAGIVDNEQWWKGLFEIQNKYKWCRGTSSTWHESPMQLVPASHSEANKSPKGHDAKADDQTSESTVASDEGLI
ncbi:hypothetical protein BDV93DRAFT_511028 [Ceratobasidium sp. AG-I]|nr:hypothetical protein BDV93DRAFT_511028 [Ceratobasidium sp. AG-I]